MSDNIIQLNEDLIKQELKDLVCSSVEEALTKRYSAGVSVCWVEDITEVLWGTKLSPETISNPNKNVYEHIEQWCSWSLFGDYPHVDGVCLKCSWGGTVKFGMSSFLWLLA